MTVSGDEGRRAGVEELLRHDGSVCQGFAPATVYDVQQKDLMLLGQ